MSATIEIENKLVSDFEQIVPLLEHVGFFLAEWVEEDSRFRAFEWRPVERDEYHVLTDSHVSLEDHVRAEIIQWAWRSGGCLIETHSHGPRGRAAFSGSDLYGFDEWVPHLKWRLQNRPYAALVTTGESIDGLAWIGSAQDPVQVSTVVLGAISIKTTGWTLARSR